MGRTPHVPGAPGADVVVLGAGVAGANAIAIAAGMRDVLEAYDGEDGYQALTLLSGPDTRAFALRLSFRPDALPAPWRREVTRPAPEAPCHDTTPVTTADS